MPLKTICCILLLGLCLTCGGAHAASAFTPDQLKKMSVFLSNFTEVYLMQYPNDSGPEELVLFGIRHNYINNYKSRIQSCTTPQCEWGSAVIDAKYVRESVKRYFDIDLAAFLNIDNEYGKYIYDGTRYHFSLADGDMGIHARVTAAQEIDGQVHMSGVLYNSEDKNQILGTVKAIAKPYTWKGKPTWALLRLACRQNN